MVLSRPLRLSFSVTHTFMLLGMLPPAAFARIGLSSVRSTLRRSSTSAFHIQQVHTFASVVPSVPATTPLSSATNSKLPGNVPDARKPGALRPHLGVQVDPNHGLYAFFRKKIEDNVAKYETIENVDFRTSHTGRAWTAAELRRKSFKDLHTLWYVLLRERNLLATQREEGRRLGINIHRIDGQQKTYRVRKSMARIKYVLNERRLAYEGSVEIFQENAQRMLLKREQKRQEHKAFLAEKARSKQEEKQTMVVSQGSEVEAVKLAQAGLFKSLPPTDPPSASSNQ